VERAVEVIHPAILKHLSISAAAVRPRDERHPYQEDHMSDLTIKRVEEFDSPNGGGFCRARATLGVSAFGMQVENFPPHFEHHPEHDHSDDGQEEVYTALSGSATLHVGGREYRLEPGIFARVGAGERRQVTTGDEPVQLLAIGGTPGAAYQAPAFTEVGAPLG
jgi:mannose-6-phosphate isomerase-like protein (cupin superfamily)